MPHKGQTFPSELDKFRLQLAKRNRWLYDGDHFEVYGMSNFFIADSNEEKLLYIAVNLPALISEYFADLMIGEGVFFDVIDSEQQENIKEISERNQLDVNIFESAVSQSMFGYSVIRVREDKELAVIEEIPIDQYFPTWSNNITRELVKVDLASTVIIVQGNKEAKHLYIQQYTKQEDSVFLEHQLWTVNSRGEIVERVSISLFDDTLENGLINLNVDRIPIWQINNIKTAQDFFGKSDYKDIEPLLEELNNRVTQISIQLIKFMNAKMAVPDGTFDDTGKLRASEADMIEIGTGEFIPQFITNSNPQIDKGFEQIDKLIRMIAAISKVPADVLGLEPQGGAEKVETVRLRLFNTTRKVDRKRVYMHTPLKEIMTMAMKIEGVEEPQPIDIVWDDVLPTDPLIKTQTLSEQVISNLKSKRKAVKELQRISDDDLDEEMKAIQDQEIPIVPSFASQPPQLQSVDQITNDL